MADKCDKRILERSKKYLKGECGFIEEKFVIRVHAEENVYCEERNSDTCYFFPGNAKFFFVRAVNVVVAVAKKNVQENAPGTCICDEERQVCLHTEHAFENSLLVQHVKRYDCSDGK